MGWESGWLRVVYRRRGRSHFMKRRAKAEPAHDAQQLRVVCLMDEDNSGDTEAHSRHWEVVYPVDHPTLKLFDDLEIREVSMPRPWHWELEGDDFPKSLRDLAWSDEQMEIYVKLANLAQELFHGGKRLRDLAGTGLLDIMPGCITVRSSFLLQFCTHGPRSCHLSPWAERPTCHCDIFGLASQNELPAIRKRIERTRKGEQDSSLRSLMYNTGHYLARTVKPQQALGFM